MLLRIDPATKSVSMLSIPATCASRSPDGARTASTPPTPTAARRCRSRPFETLTGLPVNHFIDVDSRASSASSTTRGVYIDVDRQYYNNTAVTVTRRSTSRPATSG